MNPGVPTMRPILLVEDNPEDAEFTVLALKKARVANPIDVVGDGEQALNYLQVRKSHVARFEFPVLILLDLKLPKVDGLDVLVRLDAEGSLKELPIIVTTSSKEQEDVLASYSLGVRAYFRKPVDYQKLGEAVVKLGLHWLLIDGVKGHR